MHDALLITGTHSDAGKTVVVAGLCRWLARQGVAVAPFKAQNMALNSRGDRRRGRDRPCPGGAGRRRRRSSPTRADEPGPAQAGQRHASPRSIVLGRPWREVDALGYRPLKAQLREVVLDSLADLRSRYDVVICEGAGSPAEINLRRRRPRQHGAGAGRRAAGAAGRRHRPGRACSPSLFGTLALLEADDQRLVRRLRDQQVPRRPAAARPRPRAADGADRPAVPGRAGVAATAVARRRGLPRPRGRALDRRRPPRGTTCCGCRSSGCPGCPTTPTSTRSPPNRACWCAWPRRAEDSADADLVVLPGTRATVRDLAWLRDRGLADALRRRAAARRPIVGICGGYQMLGQAIVDEVESGAGIRPRPWPAPGDHDLRRRQDRSAPPAGPPRACRSPATRSTTAARWSPVASRWWWTRTAPPRAASPGPSPAPPGMACSRTTTSAAGSSPTSPPGPGGTGARGAVSFAEVRAARLDALGDLVADGMDTDAVLRLLAGGVPGGLPFVPPGAPALAAAAEGRR